MLSGFLVVVFVMFLKPWNVHEDRGSIELWAQQPGCVDLYCCRPTLLDVRPAAHLFNANPTHLMAGRCGAFFRPRQNRSLSASLVALLLLRSGLQINPGPPTLNIASINMNSVVQKDALVIDLINNHRIDALAVCETKIAPNDPAAIKQDCVPNGYNILHLPRPTATERTRGGGLCFIYRSDRMTVKRHRLQNVVKFKSFECQMLSINPTRDNSAGGITVAIIYRPPSSSTVEFYDDLSEMLDKLGDVIDTDRLVASGDFNCGGASPPSVSTDLQTVFDTHGLRQFVESPTRRTADVSNLLDRVVGRVGSDRISRVAVQPSHVSDHDLVTWTLSTKTKPTRRLVSYKFHSLKNVDWASFQADVLRSELHTDPASTADEFADQLDAVITNILDRHCPLHERKRFVSTRRDSRWQSPEAVEAKRQRRQLERRWQSSHKTEDYVSYRKSCRIANKVIVASRGRFYNDRIQSAAADPRRRWSAIRNILHMTESREIQSVDDCVRLCNGFAQFFVEKI